MTWEIKLDKANPNMSSPIAFRLPDYLVDKVNRVAQSKEYKSRFRNKSDFIVEAIEAFVNQLNNTPISESQQLARSQQRIDELEQVIDRILKKFHIISPALFPEEEMNIEYFKNSLHDSAET